LTSGWRCNYSKSGDGEPAYELYLWNRPASLGDQRLDIGEVQVEIEGPEA
jgi:hypothetical protein